MRIPQSSPSFQELLEVVEPKRFLQASLAVLSPLVDGRYLHWDEVRRRTPPDGLTYEAWWLGLQIRRQATRTVLPLHSKSGLPFSLSNPEPLAEHLHHIDLGAGGHVGAPEEAINDDQRDRFYFSSLTEEAITSSLIEGAATTRAVAKDLLRTGRPPIDRSERMVLNNYRTMERIRDLKSEPLTGQIVKDLQRTMTEGTLDEPDSAGRLRQADEPIVVEDSFGNALHVPPPASELEARMEAMCAFANGATPAGFLHPALRSILLHFWLAYDHPFVDGNGRTARALFYWSMARHKYWLTEFLSISSVILRSRGDYERAYLYSETDQGDLTYFVLYHLDVLKRAMSELMEKVARKAKEIRQAEAQLSEVAELNHRQRALISHALRHPNAQYTVESHRRSQGVVTQTARTDLEALVTRGLLVSRYRGKKRVYSPSERVKNR
jgi:Fic family protein